MRSTQEVRFSSWRDDASGWLAWRDSIAACLGHHFRRISSMRQDIAEAGTVAKAAGLCWPLCDRSVCWESEQLRDRKRGSGIVSVRSTLPSSRSGVANSRAVPSGGQCPERRQSRSKTHGVIWQSLRTISLTDAQRRRARAVRFRHSQSLLRRRHRLSQPLALLCQVIGPT